MNFKRIISTALTVIMVFSALVAVLPLTTKAAYTDSSASAGANVYEGIEEANYNSDELKAYLSEYLLYDYATAEEMLNDELAKGLLYYVNYGTQYTLLINKYSGFVYYVNNVTGQILTSNPTSPASIAENSLRETVMSQITVSFHEAANSNNKYEYTSHKWAANRAQISVTPISGGLRVNYTLGDTTARFLLPGRITAESFESNILIPMIDQYEELLVKYCTEKYPEENFSFFENEKYIPYLNGCVNTGAGAKNAGIKYYFTETNKIYDACLKRTSGEYKEIDALRVNIIKIIGAYACYAPAKYIGDDRYKETLEKMYKDYPITQDGTAIYVYAGSELNEAKRPLSDIIKQHCTDYTFAMMYADEKLSEYIDKSPQKPVVRCALEYTFASDGSLSVRLPANSITFDETVYNFESVSPLRYFGCGDMTNEGYIFYPDGSGTIVEFDDFYNIESNKRIQLSLESPVYGIDYCYSTLEAKLSHREQVIMPVYGVVNDIKANGMTSTKYGVDNVTNGYFAIIEEGDALASLGFESGGTSHKYATAFASYDPYPSDVYDLSETISVGALGEYTIVSESKYTGSYITRYVMLTDPTVGDIAYGKDAYYASSYVGMASFYRNYLEEKGVLEAITQVSNDIPLYIEVLGAMDITAKFLSFPVTKSIPLTSFDDVQQMYKEISACKEFVTSEVARYEQLMKEAEEEGDDIAYADYKYQAERYSALIDEIDTISNINFKLTGFANGGMKFTYPAKVKWAKACGGKNGVKSLVEFSNEENKKEGTNFGVFPEFDFLYIHNTAAFDGISKKHNVSKMVDSRYASKQTYNAVTQEFESFFTMVISSDVVDKFFTKFEKKFSGYGFTNLSVSTLGSDLNSNFDEDNPINREQSKNYIIDVLKRMSEDSDYELMIDKGNIFAVEYADHVLNIAIDSSHFRYSSYAVPFVGIVLHSYVNYTGTPINYSGSQQYDILRAIENGASLYYIVCFQNTAHMKDDEDLNKYYGVDYHNWYDSIVTTYAKLNKDLSDLQSAKIYDHNVLLAERIIEEKELNANMVKLQDEILVLLADQLDKKIDEAFDKLRNESTDLDLRVKAVIDKDALVNQFADILNIASTDLLSSDFNTRLDALISKYTAEYPGSDEADKSYNVEMSNIEYTTKYSYITDSSALDKDYVYTDYTCDNGNVTMVTYQKTTGEMVKFILNYNNFTVTVRLDGQLYTLEAHEYVRIG